MNKTYAPGDNVLKCIYQKIITIKLQSVTALEKVENKPLNTENLKGKRVAVIIGNNDAEPDILDNYVKDEKFTKYGYSS